MLKQLDRQVPYILRARVGRLGRSKAAAAEAILAEYHPWRRSRTRKANFRVASDLGFFEKLYQAFLDECASYFEPFTLSARNRRQCWAYVQNGEHGTSFWHNHVRTATINGVYYLRVPDPSGKIWFRHEKKIIKLTPEEGYLYVFPDWLDHRPIGQRSMQYRISINVEIVANERPVSRGTQVRW